MVTRNLCVDFINIMLISLLIPDLFNDTFSSICLTYTTRLAQFRLHDLRLTKFYESEKNERTFFLTDPEFLLARMKAQWDEGCGRILLGDNTVVGAVMLRGIWFHSFGSLDCKRAALYIRVCMLQLTVCIPSSNWRKIRLAPDLSERKSGIVFDWLEYCRTL